MKSRNIYLDKMIRAKDNEFVKIITGVRRSGKSSLLQLFAEYLAAQNVDAEHIIEINYEKFEYSRLTQGEKLHEYLGQRITDQKTYYLLMDEVQEIEEWAKVINSIRVSYPVDLYVTGSNSRIFSGEYLTYLSGRYIEIPVYPLSLKEFADFRGYEDVQLPETYFNEYLRKGSFPAVSLTEDEELIETITAGLFDSIFSRDILLRGKIRDEGNFYKVAKFVFDNIGNSLSVNAVANTLKSQGHKISVDAVENYLKQMCNAYILYQCERYDIRGRERLRTNGKYYCVDMGLRNRLVGYQSGNMGHIIENLVYVELLRCGCQIYVGKFLDSEVDFIAVKGEQKAYIQVALSIADEKTAEREFAPFYGIRDNYPKYVISTDRLDMSKDGFIHLNLYEFLLGKDKAFHGNLM